MDIEKVLELAPKYLSEYLSVAVVTLAYPGTRFQSPVPSNLISADLALPHTGRGMTLGPYLNGKLFTFLIINAVLGTTINALIPSRKPGPDLLPTVVLNIVSWFVYSTITHWVCKLLKGVGTFDATLAVSVQLISVLYALSSFLAFVLAAVVTAPPIRGALLSTSAALGPLVDNPIAVFFLLQFLGLAVYLPLALRPVHRFGWGRTAVLAVLGLWGTLSAVIMYMSTGVLIKG